jgi:hypothetical protein
MPLLFLGTLAATAIQCGCVKPAVFHPATPDPSAGSPLDRSSVLLPFPSEDETLLGRALVAPPERGQTLVEASRPNDCAERLTTRAEESVAGVIEDGQPLSKNGASNAALETFGFQADSRKATHFYYRVSIDKRVRRESTAEYEVCCKEKGTCGYGFVSALVHGAGQYATASESTSSESTSTIPVAGGADGVARAEILHQRAVHGFVAVVIAGSNPEEDPPVGLLGEHAAVVVTPSKSSLSAPAQARFASERIEVIETSGERLGFGYVDGRGAVSESEFVRRYQNETGATDLDGAERPRGTQLIVLGSMVAAAGLIGGAVLLASSSSSSGQSWPSGGTGLAGWIGVGLGGLGVGLGLDLIGAGAAANYRGHALTRADADIFAARYNRALLRRISREGGDRSLEEGPGRQSEKSLVR